MSKGSTRRPEDREAVSRNWPFGREIPKKRSCNFHYDCDAADAAVREMRGGVAEHCHDECCEECFGY